ncbi:hypothetical protein ACFL54_00980 [Planctomycetota bacterium]
MAALTVQAMGEHGNIYNWKTLDDISRQAQSGEIRASAEKIVQEILDGLNID